jgi:hypothetical protein
MKRNKRTSQEGANVAAIVPPTEAPRTETPSEGLGATVTMKKLTIAEIPTEARNAGHKPREFVKYTVTYDGEKHAEVVSRMAPQAHACLAILVDLRAHEMPEPEVMRAVYSSREHLNTTQDPWRIFQYYRPKLVEAGVLAVTK